jgi:hypothetical protein
MTEQKIRAIVQDELNNNYRSGAPMVPPHTHDGVNNLKVGAVNLIPNTKFLGTINVTAGSSSENTLIINGIKNPVSVSFYGLSRNNWNDTTNAPTGAATVKSSITGNAQLGVVKYLIASGIVPPNGISVISNVVQGCSLTTFDGTSGYWIPRPAANPFGLAQIYSSDGTTSVGTMQVVSFTETSITLQCPLLSGWSVKGQIIIT